MIVHDLSIQKVDPSDPRYPDDVLPDHDLYLCRADTDDGPRECPSQIRRNSPAGEFGPMLQAFAAAVLRMKPGE